MRNEAMDALVALISDLRTTRSTGALAAELTSAQDYEQKRSSISTLLNRKIPLPSTHPKKRYAFGANRSISPGKVSLPYGCRGRHP
jgi:hypothetical protein